MQMQLTRIDVLRSALNMANHNLNCYSETYAMDAPKAGYKDEWAKAKEESDILSQMINEYLHYSHDDEYGNPVRYRKYICTIGTICAGKNLNNETYIEHLEIEIDTPGREHCHKEQRIVFVDKPSSDYLLAEYDERRHRCYDAGVSSSIILYVDNINYVRKVEWVSSEKDIENGLNQCDTAE